MVMLLGLQVLAAGAPILMLKRSIAFPGRSASICVAPTSLAGGLESVAVRVPVFAGSVASRNSWFISMASPRSLVGVRDEMSTRSVIPAGGVQVPEELIECELTSMVLVTVPVLML